MLKPHFVWLHRQTFKSWATSRMRDSLAWSYCSPLMYHSAIECIISWRMEGDCPWKKTTMGFYRKTCLMHHLTPVYQHSNCLGEKNKPRMTESFKELHNSTSHKFDITQRELKVTKRQIWKAFLNQPVHARHSARWWPSWGGCPKRWALR